MLIAATSLQLAAGGWWPDMADHARYGLLAAGVAWATLTTFRRPLARLVASLAASGLAGFHLVFGIVALDNGGPVPGFVALKAILAGAAILLTLALGTGARVLAARLLAVTLLAACIVAVTQWAPAIPAEGHLSW